MATERPEGGKSPGTKNLILRLDRELAERVQLVAEVEGRSVSDVIREAITEAVDRRRGDDRFIRLLEQNLRRHQHLLELLRERDGEP
jgi:predicted DNA-binding protein